MADNWPLRSFLGFGALPSAVPSARLHARHLLREWGLTDLTDSVELLVTELLSNAVTASQSVEGYPPVQLWLLSDKTRVLILVWDASPQPPERISPGEDAESGRGLLLVDAISAQ
jgi:anti-sigma regulatory factor (Ser/Thr protein kinase)